MKKYFVNVLPVIVGMVNWITRFIRENKEDIAAIVKRVEADSADGWTSEEKLELAEELFRQRVYPKLPWYMKMFGQDLVTKWAMKVIESICKKAKLIK